MSRLRLDSAIHHFKEIVIAELCRHATFFCSSLFLFFVAACPFSIILPARAAASDFEQLLRLADIPGPFRNQWLLMEAVNKGNRLAVETLIATGTDVNLVFFGANTPLRAAIETGHEDMVAVLLRRGANPNMGDPQGHTPLFVAIQKKKSALVPLLLEAGADANAVTRNGERPLFAAVRAKHAEAVRILLDHGADIAVRDVDGRSIMWIATNQRDAQIAELLLKRGAATDEIDAQGYNLLTYAVRDGDSALIRLLASKGFDVNKPDKRGRLPLSVAAKSNNADKVRTLIQIGADIRLLDRPAIDSLVRDTKNWNEAPTGFMKNLATMLLKTAKTSREGNTPLHGAAATGHAELAVALLGAGADPNARRQHGETPLHVAAGGGHATVVEILLKHGAQINTTDDSGYTALHNAALANRSEVVQLLLRHKADMEIAEKSGEGGTPLFIASDKGYTEIVRLLLAAGANPNAIAKGGGGYTPIFRTTSSDRLPLAKMLLDHGADINFATWDGTSPLIFAACNVWPKNKEVIQFYLDHGADPRRTRNDGPDALSCTASEGLDDIIRLLLHKGADPNYRKNDQWDTALMLAVRKDRTSTVKLLLQRGADVNQVRSVSSGKYESALDLALAKGNRDIIAMLRAANAKEAARLPKPVAGTASSSVLSTTTSAVKLAPQEILQHELGAYSGSGQIDRVKELLQKGAKADSQALNSAARFGRADIIRLLAQHGADVNAPDTFFKRTPLMEATTFGYFNAVETLLELGAKPDAIGNISSGETPLASAIEWNKLAIAEALLKKGANLNISLTSGSSGSNGNTLLIRAVNKRNRELVSLLAKYRADMNFQDRFGSTALHYAVSQGDENIVQILLANGARVDIENKDGDTPVMTAIAGKNQRLVVLLLDPTTTRAVSSSQKTATPAEMKKALAYGNISAVSELLRHGVDPNARDPDSGIPFLVLHASNSKTAMLMVENGANANLTGADGSSAFLTAIDSSSPESAILMLRKGADPMQMNERGEFPLLRAIQRGRFELVKLMWEQGASLDIQDARGWTGLIHLAYAGDMTGLIKLLEYGANTDIVSRQGDTALILAVRAGKADAVQVLASRSKTINHVSNSGYGALHEAIVAGRGDLVKILLDAKAGIETTTRDGLTPLMVAANANKLDMARLLLERGADARSRSRYQSAPHDYSLARYTGNGKTALMYGVRTGSIEMATLLLDHGAPVNAQDDEGNTALIMVAGGRPELIQTLIKAGAKTDLRNKMGLSAADYAKLMDRNPEIITSGTPDARFASPEKTWDRYLAALRQGDRQTALTCLISTARDKFAPFIKEASDQELRRMGNAIKNLRVTSRFGEFVEAVAVTHDGHAGIITFANRDGEWKISEM